MPESELLTQLQDLDEKIAQCVAAHKLEVRYATRPNDYVRKKLRMYIQSEHHNQQPRLASDEPGDPPSWTLRLWGKLIDATESALKPPTRQASHPMTGLVRRLRIGLSGDVKAMSGPTDIVWEKERHKEEHRDFFIVKRQGRGDAHVSLDLELDSQPPMWNMSEPLKRLVGVQQGTRTDALGAVWTYIKQRRLLENSGKVRCEGDLKALFDAESIDFNSLAQLCDKHLTKPKPYHLEYTIKPGGPAFGERACYDLDLRMPIGGGGQGSTPVDKIGADLEADRLQLRVNNLVEAARERARRRDFLLGFSASPIDFVNGVIAGQARDVRAAHRPTDEAAAMRKSEFFSGKWVEDAVLRYLHRRMSAGT